MYYPSAPSFLAVFCNVKKKAWRNKVAAGAAYANMKKINTLPHMIYRII